MDNAEIYKILNHSSVLKHRFVGSFPANVFPYLEPGRFQIINTANTNHPGEHWLLLARQRGNTSDLLFYDSFSRPLQQRFPNIYKRILSLYLFKGIKLKQFYPPSTFVQDVSTTLCGLYCIFIAYYVFTGDVTLTQLFITTYLTVEDMLRFFNANFGTNHPPEIKTIVP